MRFKVISFDADGTLVDHRFGHLVWFERIPQLYAEINGLELDEARERVFEQFRSVGEENPDWYSIRYWFDRLGLGDTRHLLEELDGLEMIYPEVEEVLETLGRDRRLVVTSNAPREFLEIELRPMMARFERVFSAPSDFNMVKRDPALYHRICLELSVEPHEVMHLGDRWADDVESPSSAGVSALHLDRSGSGDGHSVGDLLEFGQKLENLED